MGGAKASPIPACAAMSNPCDFVFWIAASPTAPGNDGAGVCTNVIKLSSYYQERHSVLDTESHERCIQ